MELRRERGDLLAEGKEPAMPFHSNSAKSFLFASLFESWNFALGNACLHARTEGRA